MDMHTIVMTTPVLSATPMTRHGPSAGHRFRVILVCALSRSTAGERHVPHERRTRLALISAPRSGRDTSATAGNLGRVAGWRRRQL
jgi:hypothetical protein